ncbi:MAG: tRNA uridine-5-carboxymethylaminomethyl(34) synthesis GTPase MnmE [Rhodocyclales bacterium]|nr:tRNA uridine-5-carboxymethylaminomethyl(34) synthesis GTPase MnmE [Rhodocyclales bacterium]
MQQGEAPREVIAAIATAPGRGGIGVVRVSGPSLAAFVEALLGRVPAPRVATFARFRDAQGAVIDEGLALFFPAPQSFTGEDVLELHGHGGPVVLQLLLERCLELGARLARPGEFTERAFLAGKIDLAQAEAVADLIDASTRAAARGAARSLTGEFSRAVRALQERLIEARMWVEASLDFPEEDLELIAAARIREKVAETRSALDRLLENARQGALLRRGLHVVIAGAPNVGKSSLLNALMGEERAIVTDIAGTTRDVLREAIQIEGIPLYVIDTAGLRDTDDLVERIGVARTREAIALADVVLALRALDRPEPAPLEEVLALAPPEVPVIEVVNKIDLTGEAARREAGADGRLRARVWLSARSGEGLELLRAALLEVAGWHAHGEDVVLARERHLEALREARRALEAALEAGEALELLAEELRMAHRAFGRILGEYDIEDLLGEIFSRFCIGK